MSSLKETLRGAVLGIAEENREAVVALLEHMNPVLTSGAVRLVGEMGITDAAPKLTGLMVHPDTAVRLAVVGAAQLLGEVSTTEMLVGALSDEESDVRVAAAEALATLGHEGPPRCWKRW